MRRGEIWWAKMPAPVGRRPVVLLSRDEMYAVRNQVTVAVVTAHIRGIPVEVKLGAADEMKQPCVIDLGTLQTIPMKYLDVRISALSQGKISEMDAAIRFSLNL